MADQEATSEGEAPAKRGMLGMILMGALLLVVIAGSVGGTLYFMGGAETPAESMEAVRPEVIYYPLSPGFVVNFATTGRSRLLQAEITLRAMDQAAIDAATAHDPLIRNRIIDVLTSQNARELQTEEGKLVLHQQLLEAVNLVLQDEGISTRIDAVLFGSFVIQ